MVSFEKYLTYPGFEDDTSSEKKHITFMKPS